MLNRLRQMAGLASSDLNLRDACGNHTAIERVNFLDLVEQLIMNYCLNGLLLKFCFLSKKKQKKNEITISNSDIWQNLFETTTST